MIEQFFVWLLGPSVAPIVGWSIFGVFIVAGVGFFVVTLTHYAMKSELAVTEERDRQWDEKWKKMVSPVTPRITTGHKKEKP